MATMVKEKRKEKKKTKDKHASRSSLEPEQPSIRAETISIETTEWASTSSEKVVVASTIPCPIVSDELIHSSKEAGPSNIGAVEIISTEKTAESTSESIQELSSNFNLTLSEEKAHQEHESLEGSNIKSAQGNFVPVYEENTYQNLNSKLERICIPKLDTNLSLKEIQDRLENPQAYWKTEEERTKGGVESEVTKKSEVLEVMENVMPSAPVLEQYKEPQYVEQEQEFVRQLKPKTQCIPLEEAMRLFGEREIAEMRAMSEREEAIVEVGPISGPDNPLVDLLSTLRTSLIAVERERIQLVKAFAEEEKYRKDLWKIEKRKVSVTEKCPCGADVSVQVTFEQAEFKKNLLTIAKLKLEGILRDVQESYCHHQHMALLAYCQIEEQISEVIKSNQNEIREALALVLQALRLSDTAPASLAGALQRWAVALSAALLAARDTRQLLHLLHLLFRQTRSVRWAARLINITAPDRSGAARAVAILDLLLSKQRLESAVECVEDADASWEEVDEKGGGGAVSEGCLREHDLLALLHAFPLRDLLARILLFTHSDITQARACDWGDHTGGHNVLKACYGVRTLLATLHRGVTSHTHYSSLREELRSFAARSLHALAGLHSHTSSTYKPELADRISAELEASFLAGFSILAPEMLYELPATLLQDDVAKEYCFSYILGLHDKSPRHIDTLSIELPVLSCESRVRIVTQVAIDRTDDYELARMVLEFLFQTGIKKKAVQCKGQCDSVAKELMPKLLATHSYLHTMAFHILADISQVEQLDPTAVEPLSASTWRPNPAEVREVLDEWTQRCQSLIQHLLLQLDYTPHSGLSLETQLTVGSWLCSFVQKTPSCPEWAWIVLRKMNVHRTAWSMPIDAPPPDPEPSDLFSTAYAILSSSWGHCLPLICSSGVSGLIKLTCSRVGDAVHCLAPVMMLMSHSPESVSLTPRFNELFSLLLKSGPSLVQRALGLGPVPGSELLTRLILKQLDTNYVGYPRSAILSAWLHALWRGTLSGASTQLEIALLASRDWQLFDTHVAMLLQEQKSTEYITSAVRDVHIAPLVCECVLRATHTCREAHTTVAARLYDALHSQRISSTRIHVDNALKYIGAPMAGDELVIYRTATAVLTAPLSHPSHLMLWRLFYHLYLQRPPLSLKDTTPPVGPLFFNGIIKSRLMAQIRKRLKETIAYHHNEVDTSPKTPEDSPQRPDRRKKDVPKTLEDDILPKLDLRDITEDLSEGDSIEEEAVIERQVKDERSRIEEENMVKYHEAAERMCNQFLRWLDEWDNVRAMPHHADVARFIPEKALSTAWDRELSRRRPPPSPDESPPTSPVSTPTSPVSPPSSSTEDNTPFSHTLQSLMRITDLSHVRSRMIEIKSFLENSDLRSEKSIFNLVHNRLGDIEKHTTEWSSEVGRLSALDSALWELVTSLRVRSPLRPIRKQCPQKCDPIAIHIQEQEWCISSGAQQGIVENRLAARTLMRKLARPRPEVARSAATLIAATKYVSSPTLARDILLRIWKCCATDRCTPAHSALTTLVQLLADRWIRPDGELCVKFLADWCSDAKSGLQQTMCGLLVPSQLNHYWPRAYLAVLNGTLPSHTAFSYLSKFEMSRWAGSLEAGLRRELLEALSAAAQRWGPTPSADHYILLELIGVHTAFLIDESSLCTVVRSIARACTQRKLPAHHWRHVTRAAETHAARTDHHQLGHLLRELGVMWWEARSGLVGCKATVPYSTYAPHVARLLHVLQRAFVATTVAMSYSPDRVALYAWSSLQESWGGWVSPHAALAPLLPSTEAPDHEAYTPMVKYFVDNVHQIMLDCPGSENSLLQLLFEWTVQTYMNVKSATSQECRVQMSLLLGALRTLPWQEHQWIKQPCLKLGLQVCSSKDAEIQSWCSEVWRAVSAESWLMDIAYEQMAPHLASLLYLFTAMTHHTQTLEQATRLPWYRLPEAAIEEAMERYFVQYHNASLAYHDLPQFRVLLFASELAINPQYPPRTLASTLSGNKRALSVSVWVRAASHPSLQGHLHSHTRCLLNTLAEIAPYIESSQGEVEQLLSRAVTIMCLEPAASLVLPVWREWVQSTNYRMSSACVSAAAVLTTFQYFAALADTAARAVLHHKDSRGWPEVFTRWSSCHWTDPATLLVRAKLYAAYAIANVHPQDAPALRSTILGVLAANVNFVENEAIVAVWICFITRVAVCSASEEAGAGAGAGAGAEAGAEARAAAGTVLARYSEEPRRSLLQVVTMQLQYNHCTAHHRLLARLATCITNSSAGAVAAYEAACAAVLGSSSDAVPWGADPTPKKLVRLAMRLFPNYDKYFQHELDLASE